MYEAPSLTRGRVCNLIVQVILGLATAVTLELSPAVLQTTSYCLI
jgi:hypothetical protein